MAKRADKAPTLDPYLLRPSGSMLSAQLTLANAIEREAVALTDCDSTTLDLLVRLELASAGRLRAVDLCRQLQLSPSHVSRMLDRAEDAGLVQREDDPEDRRAKIVAITPRGRTVVSGFAPHLHAVLDAAIHQVLAPDEIEELIGYLTRIEIAARSYKEVRR